MPNDAVGNAGDLVWAYRVEASKYGFKSTVPPVPGMLACTKRPKRNARVLTRVPDARNACRFFIPLKSDVDVGPGYVPGDHPADLNWRMACETNGFRFEDGYADAVRKYAEELETATASVVAAVRSVLAGMEQRGVT